MARRPCAGRAVKYSNANVTANGLGTSQQRGEAEVQEFLAMGGYGFYVWASYGLAVLLVAANVLLPVLRERRLLRDIARRARRSAT